MNNYYILLAVLLCFTINAQNKLSKLNTADLSTSVIIAVEPLSKLTDLQDKIIDNYSFYDAVNKISKADASEKTTTDLEINQINLDDKVDLGVLISSYASLKEDAVSSGKIIVDSGNFLTNPNNDSVFKINHIGLLSPLSLRHKGLNIQFDLSKVFNTTLETIQEITIDFNDGNGARVLDENQTINISYNDIGEKIISSQIILNNGTVFSSQSRINIEYSNADLNRLFGRAIITFESTGMAAPNLTPYGESTNAIGKGEYDIFLSPDGILDKPIFLVDGFDPGDTRNTLSIYDLLNFDDSGTISNLGDVVRAEGFDIVVLNFPSYVRVSDAAIIDGGADYIERNAMLLAELITRINTQKIGSEPNVIIGPSMGGLISRYALNFMENQSLNHDTRLWISFDSPHLGANVPIGFQYLFNYMAYGLDLGGIAGDQSIVAIRPIIDGMLKSPAARQMLTDHFEPHLQSGSTVDFNAALTEPIAHNFNTIFFNNLNSLTASGFPENLRKVSIINGSGINARYLDKTAQPIQPGREILNTTIEDVGFQTDASFKTRFSPNSTLTNEMAYIYIDAIWFCFCDLTTRANTKAFDYTNGIDAASGGLFDLGGLSGSLGSDDTINAFFNALQTDYFNFIPSISALALEVTNDEINWFHTPTSLVTQRSVAVNNVTPFDNWFMPDENEPHVTLTRDNVDFALEEIMPAVLSTTSFDYNELTLIENPIKSNIIKLSSSKTLNNATIIITNITGQVVYNKTKTINTLTEITAPQTRGVYLMTISNNTIIKTFKIII